MYDHGLDAFEDDVALRRKQRQTDVDATIPTTLLEFWTFIDGKEYAPRCLPSHAG